MQENFGNLLKQLEEITVEAAMNVGRFSNRLSKISGVADTQLDKFRDGAVFKTRDDFAQKQQKLVEELENCNQKLEEFQKIPSNAPEYSYKLQELIGLFQLTNINATQLLKELDELDRKVSDQAEKRFKERQSAYNRAKAELEKEISAVREVNQPIVGYIQGIETTIKDLEKNGVEPSLLTASKKILQHPQQTVQQALNEADSADRKIQTPPTPANIAAETSSIRGMTAKVKQANKPLTEKEYDQLDITNRLVSILKYSSDLSKTLSVIETKISSNLSHLDIETATDEAAKNLGRQTVSQKVKLEKEKKNLQALSEDIKKLNEHMSSHDPQDPSVLQSVRNSINDLSRKITEIGERVTPIQKNVESISNQVHERNIAPINALKQRLEQIKAKRDESNQLGYVDHEKEINEKIKDFTDQCLALETNFDNLTREEQKSEIEKLEVLVLQLESYIFHRYHGMAGSYKLYEEGTKKLANIRDERKRCETRLGEVNREIANNINKGNAKEKLERKLGINKDRNADLLIAVTKTNRLDSKVQKLRNDANKFVVELDDFIKAIEGELREGALGQQTSIIAQKAFKALAGQEIADEMGEEWGINRENERREKIQKILIEAKEIRDELKALNIDESYTGQLSKETYERIEKLVNKLNEKASHLNRLITAAQEEMSQAEAGLRKLFGQTAIKKEASGFNKFMQALCIKASKFLQRVQLHSDYRDWRTLYDEEPDRLNNRELLQNEKSELVLEKEKLQKDLIKTNQDQKQQASRQNRLKAIEWPLTYQNEDGNTLLHIAVSEGDVEMLLLFLQQSGHESFDSDLLNIKNKQGKTAGDLALESQNVSIVSLLSKDNDYIDYSRWRSIINSKDLELISQFAQTYDIEFYTLHIDFMSDRESRKFLMSVLEKSPDVKNNYLLNAKDKNGNTLLHAAIQSRDISAANWLISNGANIEIKNDQGNLPVDLMKKENEAYSKQQSDEKNQAYVATGLSIGSFIAGGGALIAAAALGATPLGWAIAGIAALVLAGIGIAGIIKNYSDISASASNSLFPNLPVEVTLPTEKLVVNNNLLATLEKQGVEILSRKPIAKNQTEIEVFPTTKQLINKITMRIKNNAEKIVPIMGVFDKLQLKFNESKKKIAQLKIYSEFLQYMKDVRPDMLEAFKYEENMALLSDQIKNIERTNSLMVEADQAIQNAGRYLEMGEFTLFNEEFSKFERLMNEHNLVDAVRQIEQAQEQINSIGPEISKLRDKVGQDVQPDIQNFEQLKKDLEACKNKRLAYAKADLQDHYRRAALEKIDAQIARAENLVKLAEKNKNVAGEYLDQYALHKFGNEWGLFIRRNERLGTILEGVFGDIDVLPEIKTFDQLTQGFMKCKEMNAKYHRDMYFEARYTHDGLQYHDTSRLDVSMIAMLEKIDAQIARAEKLMELAENNISGDGEHFNKNEIIELNRELTEILQNIIGMQNDMESIVLSKEEDLAKEVSEVESLEAELFVEDNQFWEDFLPAIKGFERLKKAFIECRNQQSKYYQENSASNEVVLGKLKDIDVQIKHAENLIKLAEKNASNARKYFDAFEVFDFNKEWNSFERRNERLETILQGIVEMQRSFEANIAPSKEEPVKEESEIESLESSSSEKDEQPLRVAALEVEPSQKEPVHSTYAHITQFMSAASAGVSHKIQEMRAEVEQKIQEVKKEEKPAAPLQEEQGIGVTHSQGGDFFARRKAIMDAKKAAKSQAKEQESDEPTAHQSTRHPGQ